MTSYFYNLYCSQHSGLIERSLIPSLIPDSNRHQIAHELLNVTQLTDRRSQSNSQWDRSSAHLGHQCRLKSSTLVETAGIFHMLQGHSRRVIFRKHKKFRLRAGKKLVKLNCSLENPGSISLRSEIESL